MVVVVVVEVVGVVVGNDDAVIERRFENHPTAKVVANKAADSTVDVPVVELWGVGVGVGVDMVRT